MTQLVRLDNRSRQMLDIFKANRDRMMKGVPKGLDPNRLLNIAFNTVAYDAKLLQCSPQSIVGGVFEALKLGITIGGPMQEGWLIPFQNSKSKQLDATLIVGYQGYRNIIDRARSVLDLHPRAVHVQDEFDYWFGSDPKIIHRPKGPTPLSKEELKAVYVVANLRGGGKQMEVLEREEIEAHRERSRAKNSGPWVTDYVPMALKTAVRKIAKYLPKSNELLLRALDLDDKADRGVEQDFEIEDFEIPGSEPKDSRPALDQVRSKLEAQQGKKASEAHEDTDDRWIEEQDNQQEAR